MFKEDSPTNSAGSGEVAGIGVGPNGEPGVRSNPKNKYKKKNSDESNNRSSIIGNILRRQYIEEAKKKLLLSRNIYRR